MTTWPDPARPGVPLNPDQDGWHWMKARSDNLKATWREKFPAQWTAGNRHWIHGTYAPEYAAENWIYLGPVLTPSEAAALQARADRNAAGFARVDAEAERAKFLHKQEIAALQKRCEEAEKTAIQVAECYSRETRRADALQARVAKLEKALKINFHKHVQGASAADVVITRILPYSVSDAELKRLTGGKKDE